MKKIAIVGSRNFNDYSLIEEVVQKRYIENLGLCSEDVTIISGGARGADSLAEKLANCRGYRMIVFPAEWGKYGKKAGMIRNQYIIENADVVFAFWDGKSPGTANSISLARRFGKELFVEVYLNGTK